MLSRRSLPRGFGLHASATFRWLCKWSWWRSWWGVSAGVALLLGLVVFPESLTEPRRYDRIGAGSPANCAVRVSGAIDCYRDGVLISGVPSGRFVDVEAHPGRSTCGLRKSGVAVCWEYDPREPRVIGDTVTLSWVDEPQREPGVDSISVFSTDMKCALADSGSPGRHLYCRADQDLADLLRPAWSHRGEFITIDMWGRRVCALLTDGAVECYGDRFPNEATPPAGRFLDVAVGRDFGCAIKETGAIVCWGDSSADTAYHTRPPSGYFTAITVGALHGCAIRRHDGRVKCWGHPFFFGNLNTNQRSAIAIDAAPSHTCVLWDDRTFDCHGDKQGGQTSPPAEHEPYHAISAGGAHMCGMHTGHSIACWGWARSPEVPNKQWGSLDSGSEHSCAVSDEAAIWCWDRNGKGQEYIPSGDHMYDSISVGTSHACALRHDDGTLECWPFNDTDLSSLTPDTSMTDFGLGHFCAALLQQKWDCWILVGHAEIDGAQSPDEIEVKRRESYRVRSSTEQFVSVSVGHQHGCALRDDHTVLCWGDNWRGQADPPDARFRTLSAGFSHTCGILLDNGRVKCWGQAIPDPNEHVFDYVESGAGFNCALRRDRTVYCWGDGGVGQLDAPGGQWDQLAVGHDFACARGRSGSVECWGAEGSGATTDVRAVPAQLLPKNMELVNQRRRGRVMVCLTKSRYLIVGFWIEADNEVAVEGAYVLPYERMRQGTWHRATRVATSVTPGSGTVSWGHVYVRRQADGTIECSLGAPELPKSEQQPRPLSIRINDPNPSHRSPAEDWHWSELVDLQEGDIDPVVHAGHKLEQKDRRAVGRELQTEALRGSRRRGAVWARRLRRRR